LVSGAVSSDGTRVFWTASGDGDARLYLRLNADQEQSEVSGGECTEAAKACTLPVSTGAARFWAGSEDGSRAIFTEGEKLFEYLVEEDEGELFAEAFQIADGVKGLLGASKDGKRIYFVSTKKLDDEAKAGELNLYYRDAESEGEEEVEGAPVFIATLAEEDVLNGQASFNAAVTPVPFNRAARVTPDGLAAAFQSRAALTGAENIDQNSGEVDAQVFVYDADAEGGAGRLICASCDPSGARPVGRNIGNNISQAWAAATIPAWESDLYASRALSDDGSRLFFNSFGPLVSRDTNGKQDVYEWQAADSQRACEEAGAQRYAQAAAGCISLVSSGESVQDSKFIDASPSGADIFFASSDSLLSQDPGLVDIYDARVNGGFPPPRGRPAPCEGETCQSPASPPNDPTPSSASFQGAGDPSGAKPRPRECGKGKRKVRSAGKARCVPKRKAKRASRQANSNRRKTR
jgi:hypothetical protein